LDGGGGGGAEKKGGGVCGVKIGKKNLTLSSRDKKIETGVSAKNKKKTIGVLLTSIFNIK